MRANTVKKLLKAGKPAVGTWLSLGNVTAARFLARAGFDWLTVDIEHSLVGIETAVHMFGSIADAGGVPLAAEPEGPTIFMALEKLGLKLESSKGPVDTLVIDHVEKPAEN